MNEPAKSTPPESFGRYVLHAPIARGGMATVHTARLIGAEGFSRLVAAKRLHPQFTEDPDFVAMFHDEARIASKIHHPNVVPVLDVVLVGQEVILVQEYVHGVPLHKLFKEALTHHDNPIPVDIVVAIVVGILGGLHAAHETKDDMDQPLEIVHRDVSPQNVIVSVDGIPRLLDFGIAKAQSSAHVTRAGFFKGKIAYMAPEQLRGEVVTRTADVYAAGVVLWELLVHRRIHEGRGETELYNTVLSGAIPALTVALENTRAAITDERWERLTELEPIVARALAVRPQDRFASAADMLDALLKICRAATPIEVAQWVKTLGAEYLEQRHKVLASNEESYRSSLSRLRASSLGSGAPQSGVQLMPGSQRPDGTRSLPTTASASDPKRGRLPWAVAATLLLTVGILLGVLGVRRSAPEPAVRAPLPAPRPAEPPPPTAVATVARPLDPPAPTTSPLAPVATAPAAKPLIHVPVVAAPPPPQHVAARPSTPAPPATHSVPSPSVASTTSTTAVTGTPSAKPDCNPPFYFDGSKKLFKPSCI